MEVDPKDYDVVKLLTALKKSEVQYPSDLLAFRRQRYVRRVAEISLGLGVATGLKSSVKAAKAANLSSVAGGLVETALVMAIVAEAGTAAYFYRNDIARLIQSYSGNPQVQVITSAPQISSPNPLDTESPEITETPVLTETGTVTFAPTVLVGNPGANVQAKSTPDPNGNNGNHFGQTANPPKKPGGGGSGDNGKGKSGK